LRPGIAGAGGAGEVVEGLGAVPDVMPVALEEGAWFTNPRPPGPMLWVGWLDGEVYPGDVEDGLPVVGVL